MIYETDIQIELNGTQHSRERILASYIQHLLLRSPTPWVLGTDIESPEDERNPNEDH